MKNGLTETPDTFIPYHASKDYSHPQNSVGNLIGLGYHQIPKVASSTQLKEKRMSDLLAENKESCQSKVGKIKDGIQRLTEREAVKNSYHNDLKAQKLAAKGL